MAETTDRELLELAAKATGYKLQEKGRKDGAFIVLTNDDGDYIWNPLRNHDQAKQLRHALCLTTGYVARFSQLGACAYATYPVGEFCWNSIMQNIEEAGGKKAALRRAITRAAAEIGKAIP
jgi:hypothetical protein